MIFQALYRFAKSQNLLDDTQFTDQTIHCVIRLRRSGSLAGILRVTDKEQTKRILVSKISSRNSAAIACLGSDTLNRVVPHFDSKANAFARKTQKLFIEQLELVSKQSKHHGVKAVLKFLRQLHQKKTARQSVVKKLKAIPFKPSEWVSFEVEGESGLLPEWAVLRKWWTERQTEQRSAATAHTDEVPCMVTGQSCVPVRTHGTRIKVAPGGLPGGTALVSSDKAAFSSYNFDKALVSPMSEEAVEAYIRAINWLGNNRNENYHYRTGYNKGDTIFLFWSDQPLETRNPGKAIELGGLEDLLKESPEPAPASRVPLAAKKLIGAPSAGTLDSAHAEATSHFYCLSLSGASARAIIRGWIDQPLPIARENVTKWFSDLTVQLDRPLKADDKIVAETGRLWNRWPLWQLVVCLQGKGDSAKEHVAQQRQQLWEMALLGPQRAAPLALLALAVARIPAAREITPVRAALIQLLLKRINKRKDIMKTEIDLSQQTVAFHCGRLLRLLQSIQTAALGDTNATVVSRFYAGASAMPGGVFGTLLSKVQPHINKIRGDKPKLAGWFDARIAEVVGYIVAGGGFPQTNDPVAQGDFALGFYWQRLSTKKEQPEAEPDETETTETAN